MVSALFYYPKGSKVILGDYNITDCEHMVKEFYNDFSLSIVETKLQEKTEAYQKPQDDSFRNQKSQHGPAFNAFVKQLVEQVMSSRELIEMINELF